MAGVAGIPAQVSAPTANGSVDDRPACSRIGGMAVLPGVFLQDTPGITAGRQRSGLGAACDRAIDLNKTGATKPSACPGSNFYRIPFISVGVPGALR